MKKVNNENTYRFIALDVWGNVRDGWEVNQQFYTDRYIHLATGSGMTGKQILTQCRLQGIIETIVPFEVYTNDEYRIEVEYKNGRPAFMLEIVENTEL